MGSEHYPALGYTGLFSEFPLQNLVPELAGLEDPLDSRPGLHLKIGNLSSHNRGRSIFGSWLPVPCSSLSCQMSLHLNRCGWG